MEYDTWVLHLYCFSWQRTYQRVHKIQYDTLDHSFIA